jgi:thiol-disulfide isomerase/thioredoxin
MPKVLARRICTSILLTLAGPWSFAQQVPPATPPPIPPGAPGRPATTQPATQAFAPAVQAEARALIDAALQKYRAAKTYQDRLAGRFRLEGEDRAGKPLTDEIEYAASLRFAAPNRVALASEHAALFVDGKQAWLHVPELQQYQVRTAPATLNYEELRQALPVEDPPHPVLLAITQPQKTFAQLFPMVLGFTAVEREAHEGRPGMRVHGLFDAAQSPFDFGPGSIPFSLWFDEQSGLLAEIRLDLTDTMRRVVQDDGAPADEESGGPPVPAKVTRAGAYLAFQDVRLDAEIPVAQFAFQPGAADKKVEEFALDEPQAVPSARDLIGQPAPALGGTALDGQPLDLEKLRGRVIVLDFWATWCAPCVQAMPGLQKLSEKYANQPVSIIGVTLDSKNAEGKVKSFLADKKFTFRQFHDPQGEVGRSFKVQSLPTTVLLDKQGVVQAVHIGAGPGLHEELEKQLERLLKGETLYNRKELKQPAAPPPAAG